MAGFDAQGNAIRDQGIPVNPLDQQNALLQALMGQVHGVAQQQHQPQHPQKIDEDYSGPMGMVPWHPQFHSGAGLYGGAGSFQGNMGWFNPFSLP